MARPSIDQYWLDSILAMKRAHEGLEMSSHVRMIAGILHVPNPILHRLAIQFHKVSYSRNALRRVRAFDFPCLFRV